MKCLTERLNNIILRNTNEEDIEFVINAERQSENEQYVGQWPREQHLKVLLQDDFLHLIVEEAAFKRPIGYIILAGLQNPNHSVEFRRIVITEKGMGFGRDALKLVKKIAFEKLNAHRLWLDVRYKNKNAQSLYKSEGFTEEGVLRECIFYNGAFESLVVMSILDNELKA